ncbi:MAG TPA: spore coat protein CotJB [Firmicutes bacterium]|jgi:spore coat protein JB|nr:spore coat protein CotJB [Bacillota bacterium]HOQ23070.1 spore coat protein CotJB [Bacillota bacterium]HPT66968.1 spore coat protein CotJB [Bacillota bacterium]
MHEEQLRLLKEIMAVDFSLVELNLFLDTHPCDQRALMDFNNLCCQSKALRRQYEQCYGPLMACSDAPPRIPWGWVETPWPWQIDYGRS